MAGIFGDVMELVAFSPNVFVQNMSLCYGGIRILTRFHLYRYTRLHPLALGDFINVTKCSPV